MTFQIVFIFGFSSRNVRQTSFPFDVAVDVMQKSLHTQALNGAEVIEVNQVRITSNSDGTIR